MTALRGAARAIGLDPVDPIFARLRIEAEETVRRDPEVAGLMFLTVLNQTSLEAAIIHRIATKLAHQILPGELIRQTYSDIIAQDLSLGEAFRADIAAFVDRDPACARVLDPVFYFKGFHAIQTHRLGHALWTAGRRDFALYLQSRASEVFQTDIHPAARIGKGVFLDHGTGVVIGATAVVEDDVSLLQDVTLGGTGKETGDRHPKIRRGVLIGASAQILGNIEIGRCSHIAAGSVVLHAVPDHKIAAGVPARVVGEASCAEPSRFMDQILAIARAES